MVATLEIFQKVIANRLKIKNWISLGGQTIRSWGEIAQGTFSFIREEPTGDDAGVYIEGGQLTVGTNALGQETCLGEGDSYPVPLAFHCTIGNTTNLVITGATDVTSILESDEGSTAGLFNGVAAGNYLLVGSDYTFGGAKAKIDTLATVEGGNVVGEYLSNNTPTWTNAPFMATDANYPYEQNANNISTFASKSEQWRFGFNPLILPTSWDKVTLTINGVEYTKYWGRFRITSIITGDPVIQQIKLHSNRWECNADGTTEYFGRSRYPKTIEITKHTNSTKNPANENILVASGITEVRTDNEFINGANDGLILRGTLPNGLDTSIPVQVIVDWYAKTDNVGDVELELEVVSVSGSFVYDGNATKGATVPVVTSVDTDNLKRQTSTFLVPISTAQINDLFYGSLFRDASSGNSDDTLVGNIVITDFRVVGYFWRP